MKKKDKLLEEEVMKQPGVIKKTWKWLWKSDSVLSWVVSLVLAFLIVKFILFPGLSLIFNTQLPLVVVESSSMSHPKNFVGIITGNVVAGDSFDEWYDEKGNWYESRNINKQEMETWDFENGFDKGDIILSHGWDKELEIGDVIIFNANHKYPLIHRIINIQEKTDGKMYSTKGDNNIEQLFDEKTIKEQAVVGKAVGRIPKLGYIKLAFVKITDFFK